MHTACIAIKTDMPHAAPFSFDPPGPRGRPGKMLFDLSIGEPRRQKFPGKLLQDVLLRERINHYYPAFGLAALRSAIISRFYPEIALPNYTVMMTHGAINGIDILMRAFVAAGDEILIADPAFPPYYHLAGFTRAKVRSYQLTQTHDGFSLDIESIATAVTKQTRMLIINSPNNPTGALLSALQRQALIDLLDRFPKLILISDEVYGEIVFDEYLHLTLAGIHQRIFCVSSFSKSFSLQGLRLGWIVAATSAIDVLAPYFQSGIGCISSVGQEMALELLTSNDWKPCSYAEARSDVCRILDYSTLSYIKPKGSFFVLIKVAQESSALAALQEVGIKAVGGTLFGQTTRDYIRCCFAQSDSDVKQGFTLLAHTLRSANMSPVAHSRDE